MTINKDLERLSAGEIGFSVEDGKAIMAHLQQVVVNQQCEAYVLTRVRRETGKEKEVQVLYERAAKTLGFYAALSKGGSG